MTSLATQITPIYEEPRPVLVTVRCDGVRDINNGSKRLKCIDGDDNEDEDTPKRYESMERAGFPYIYDARGMAEDGTGASVTDPYDLEDGDDVLVGARVRTYGDDEKKDPNLKKKRFGYKFELQCILKPKAKILGLCKISSSS